jgi:hypothetical protein
MTKEDFIAKYIFAALRGEWYRKWVRDAPVGALVHDAEQAYKLMQHSIGKTL